MHVLTCHVKPPSLKKHPATKNCLKKIVSQHKSSDLVWFSVFHIPAILIFVNVLLKMVTFNIFSAELKEVKADLNARIYKIKDLLAFFPIYYQKARK